MKITPGDSHKTKQYFETLFVKDDCKNVIGYIKEQGKVEEFKARWDRIKIGDLVVVMQGMSKIFGVVEITSNSWDVDKDDVDWAADWFYHRRNAKLIRFFKEPIISEFPTNSDTIIEYSGAGAVKICDMVWDIIKEDYYSIKEKEGMEKYLDLLEYKKQIILQGPPGTGKTRLAKEIAKKFTNEEKMISYIDAIDKFFENFDLNTDRQNHRNITSFLLNQFREKFKPSEIINLSLENYALGRPEKDGFCYWLEYKLNATGKYNGQANKGKIYFRPREDRYIKSGFLENESSDTRAMEMMAVELDKVVNQKFENGVNFEIGRNFVLKILNTYYPEIYFPINSEECLNNALKLFDVDFSNLNYIEKNKKLQTLFLAKKEHFKKDVTNYEFMYFLFDTFGLKGNIEFQGDKVVINGKYKIIQFHPAYSYEDFVRGISAKTNEKGQVHYKVENRILAELAQEALDNPSARYVLIIDEINRANLASVLGELIYALEYRYIYDKNNYEEAKVESIYDISTIEDEPNRELILPENLYIIGTMNTADRSVGHIDYAIRRRFGFVDVLPTINPIGEKAKEKFKTVCSLFIENFDEVNWEEPIFKPSKHLSSDFKPEEVMLGHSYFITKEKVDGTKLPDENKQIELKLKYEVVPILKEYVKDGILLENDEVKKIINGLVS
ncbi:AAA family ATPase [Flavobacterium oreochromis]|uniref:AAA family ATPase n=1 Tax=Flavobacterium oreochromis TaxID=2906078 RepID=A0ABW8PD84_9FLAO